MPSLEEQETVIQYNRNDKKAIIYTSDSTTITKIDKLCVSAPDYYTLKEENYDKEGKLVSKTYILNDKKMIAFRKAKRVLSEEQKKLMGERLRNANCAQKSPIWQQIKLVIALLGIKYHLKDKRIIFTRICLIKRQLTQKA